MLARDELVVKEFIKEFIKPGLKGFLFPTTTLTQRRVEVRGRVAGLKKRSEGFLTSLLLLSLPPSVNNPTSPKSCSECLFFFRRQPDSLRRLRGGAVILIKTHPVILKVNIQRDTVTLSTFISHDKINCIIFIPII